MGKFTADDDEEEEPAPLEKLRKSEVTKFRSYEISSRWRIHCTWFAWI